MHKNAGSEFHVTPGAAGGPRVRRLWGTMAFMRIRFNLACAVLLLALSLPAKAADPVWIQLSSPNFVLYTDTTEIKGRRLLEDFEGRFAALETVIGGIPQRQFPIQVFLFSKKED